MLNPFSSHHTKTKHQAGGDITDLDLWENAPEKWTAIICREKKCNYMHAQTHSINVVPTVRLLWDCRCEFAAWIRLVLRKTETLSTTKLAIFHILFQEPQNKGKPSLLSKREGGKGRERNRKVNVEDWDVIRTLTTLNPFTIRPDMSLLYIALIRFHQVGIEYFKVNFAVGCENEDRGNILINESQKNVDIAVNLRIRLREKSFFHLV